MAREAIKKKIFMLGKFRQFIKDSDLTEEDALTFGREVSRKAMKRHKE